MNIASYITILMLKYYKTYLVSSSSIYLLSSTYLYNNTHLKAFTQVWQKRYRRPRDSGAMAITGTIQPENFASLLILLNSLL